MRAAAAAIGVGLAVWTAGCAGLSGARVDKSRVTWAPFVVAHIADPRIDQDGAMARLTQAAKRLSDERYLEAIVVSGDLGGGPEAAAEIAAVLQAARRPLFIAGAEGAGAVASDAPVRGLRLLAASAGSATPSPEAIRALEGPVRDALASIRGEFAVLALDWSPLTPGVVVDEVSAASAGFSYLLEASERLRVVVAPGGVARVERQGGLIYVATPPLSVGGVRLIAVRKHRLRTWFRSLGEGATDGPETQVDTR